MNGRAGDPRVSCDFTCIKHASSSMVDYVLCKHAMLQCIREFCVCEPILLTDQCAVSVTLCCSAYFKHNDDNVIQRYEENDLESVLLSYKWNSDNRAEFLNNIRSEQYQNQLQLINNDMKGARVTVDIDKNLDQFYDIIHGVCKPLLKQRM